MKWSFKLIRISVLPLVVVLASAITLSNLVQARTSAPAAPLPTTLKLPSGPVSATYTAYLAPSDAAFHITLGGFGSGFDVNTSATYLAWCLEDWSASIMDPSVVLYSSYDPNMPLDIKTYQSADIPLVHQGVVKLGDPVPWPEVNWILNNKNYAGPTNKYDIQNAIHLIVWGTANADGFVSPTAAALANDAKSHDDFVPVAGQTIGVLMYADGLGIANRIYQDTIMEVVMPQLPALTLVKFTNGQVAADPNGTDVPQLKPGDPVTWTYQVTNTGNVSIAKANVAVTDDQTGITPVFEKELSGNGDAMFDPGEVWLYTASSTAVNLQSPPAGVKTVLNACTMQGTQPARTAYINHATAAIPGASATAASSYCNPPNPGVTIVKYTNSALAADPNGTDVPELRPGDPVTWTYKVTNTGDVSIPKADVVVTDSQPGVTPVFDKELSGNGDAVFNPGEVWQYKASSVAADLSTNPPGITLVQKGCSYGGSLPNSPAYVNTATVSIPGGTSAQAASSYCNPLHYPYYGENAFLGVEDWYNGDYDYNDFGMYIRMEEVTNYTCYNGKCGPYLTRVIITTTAVIHDSAMDHLIHLRRPFNGSYSYTITRSVPADPNPLTLFDGATGKETPAGSYTGTGDLNVTLYNTAKYGRHQKQIGEQIVIDVHLNDPQLNPRLMGTPPRSYKVGNTTFTDLDPIMSNYDFWEEGDMFQSRWHLADTRPIDTSVHESFGAYTQIIPAGTVVPFIIVIPFTNWIPAYESSTITGPYGFFASFYTTSFPATWYLPAMVTNSCVVHGGLSFGPYPGQANPCGNIFYRDSKKVFLPDIQH